MVASIATLNYIIESTAAYMYAHKSFNPLSKKHPGSCVLWYSLPLNTCLATMYIYMYLTIYVHVCVLNYLYISDLTGHYVHCSCTYLI